MRAGWLVLLSLASAGCCLTSINPATGARQLDLVGETSEIRYGKKADRDLVASFGEVAHPRLTEITREIGQSFAKVSERPALPWTFRILDDPAVNAFAVPGGHVYVTRGLLTHLTSVDQLAGVLAHEVGHVTARHSVEQLSRGILAGVGIGVASAVDPDGRHIGGFASQLGSVYFLAHSRKDEYEADDLGLRYLLRTERNPHALLTVFDVLGRIEARQLQGERLPTFLRTHPQTNDRRARLAAKIGAAATTPDQPDSAYIRLLDGLKFGPDPREGFFIDEVFVHPAMGFQFDLPRAWKGINQKHAVIGASAEGDALVRMAATESSLETALDDFQKALKIELRERSQDTIHGRPAVRASFQVAAEPGKALKGWVVYIQHGDHVLQLIGLCLMNQLQRYQAPIAAWFRSFAPLKSPRLRRVQPMRVVVVELDKPMTLAQFAKSYPSAIDLETLAIINHTTEAGAFDKGALLKRVLGFNVEKATRDLLK